MPNHPRPTTALKMLFAALLLRRTPSSRMGSEPILRLPVKRVVTSLVTLSPGAREIYNSIYRNAASKLDKLCERQQLQQQLQPPRGSNHTLCQFSTAFEMLLRCRQSCLHPYIAVAALRRARGLMSNFTLSSSSTSISRTNNSQNTKFTRHDDNRGKGENINDASKEVSTSTLIHSDDVSSKRIRE